MSCVVKGCKRALKYIATGHYGKMCSMHYERKRVHGDVLFVLRKQNPRGVGNISPQGYKRYGQVLEHRIIWQATYGIIPLKFHIHHKNGNKLDNSIKNLQCLSPSQHAKLHKGGHYGIY